MVRDRNSLRLATKSRLGDGRKECQARETTSSGTATIHYNNSNGLATVVFNGLVYVNSLTNPLVNSDLDSRGGRLQKRGGP